MARTFPGSLMAAIDRVKKCYACQEIKDVDDFSRDASRPDGRQPRCKVCYDRYKGENREAIRAKAKIYNVTYAPKYYAENAEALRERSRRFAKANPDKSRQASRKRYREKPEAVRAYRRQYFLENRGLIYARNAARRALRLKAIPKWADPAKIKKVYEAAQWMTENTGETWHVDHIVPLKSPVVCGLHCEANLTILPGLENIVKGNRYWPDMFE